MEQKVKGHMGKEGLESVTAEFCGWTGSEGFGSGTQTP